MGVWVHSILRPLDAETAEDPGEQNAHISAALLCRRAPAAGHWVRRPQRIAAAAECHVTTFWRASRYYTPSTACCTHTHAPPRSAPGPPASAGPPRRLAAACRACASPPAAVKACFDPASGCLTSIQFLGPPPLAAGAHSLVSGAAPLAGGAGPLANAAPLAAAGPQPPLLANVTCSACSGDTSHQAVIPVTAGAAITNWTWVTQKINAKAAGGSAIRTCITGFKIADSSGAGGAAGDFESSPRPKQRLPPPQPPQGCGFDASLDAQALCALRVEPPGAACAKVSRDGASVVRPFPGAKWAVKSGACGRPECKRPWPGKRFACAAAAVAAAGVL